MSKSVKVFLLVLCALLAVGLVCIGCGVLMDGSFGTILAEMAMDFAAFTDGVGFVVAPTIVTN